MQKNFVVLGLVIGLLFSWASVQAQNRTIYTAGLSWWGSSFSWETEDGEKIGDIGTGNMVGPYLSISKGRWNFGTSLLWGSFPVEDLERFSSTSDFEIADQSMGRGDLNFTLGYRILPIVNLFVGVKYINWTVNATVRTSDQYYDPDTFTFYPYTINSDVELSENGAMFGFGASLSVPFGTSGMYGFFTLAGMGGTLKNETNVVSKLSEDSYVPPSFGDTEATYSESEDVDAVLAAVNLGIGYRFRSGLGMNLGYRADLFSETVDDPNAENPRIRVEGLLLTFSYTF